jgi:xanthine dehydrogenase YagT iron-sulfur-binding subunit
VELGIEIPHMIEIPTTRRKMPNPNSPPPPIQTTNSQAPESVTTSLSVNGHIVTATHDSRVTLLDFLRDELALVGTKKGCDHGQCGSCTVLVDGERALACLTLTAALKDRSVRTIENVGEPDQLHPIQTAFIKHDAFQCGFCTPGQIMSALL